MYTKRQSPMTTERTTFVKAGMVRFDNWWATRIQPSGHGRTGRGRQPPPPPPPPVDNNFEKFLRKIFFWQLGHNPKMSGKFLSAPLIFSFRYVHACVWGLSSGILSCGSFVMDTRADNAVLSLGHCVMYDSWCDIFSENLMALCMNYLCSCPRL
jgi:hypothetical protein